MLRCSRFWSRRGLPCDVREFGAQIHLHARLKIPGAITPVATDSGVDLSVIVDVPRSDVLDPPLVPPRLACSMVPPAVTGLASGATRNV